MHIFDLSFILFVFSDHNFDKLLPFRKLLYLFFILAHLYLKFFVFVCQTLILLK
jgi:hypothetical protein